MVLLGEKKATPMDVICLMLSMVGVLIMILAAVKEKEGIDQEKKEYTWIYVVVLIFLPFSKSMG